MSTMLYGCKLWLNGDIKPLEKLYKWYIKTLLGVRKTTNNDICLVELGMPPLKALIKRKQRTFFSKMWLERNGMDDDPLIYAMHTVLNYNDSQSRVLRDMTVNNINDVQLALVTLKTNILNSNSNRIIFYKLINTQLDVHTVYIDNMKVNEIERMSWTRLRLSAHSLAIERGRWNRRGRGRLPIEERLCPCGQIQTEAHIIENCLMSLQVRQTYNFSTVNDLMITKTDFNIVCSIVHKLLSIYYSIFNISS